jgi:hypothetical protein
LRNGREIKNGEGNHVSLDAPSRAQVTAGNLDTRAGRGRRQSTF